MSCSASLVNKIRNAIYQIRGHSSIKYECHYNDAYNFYDFRIMILVGGDSDPRVFLKLSLEALKIVPENQLNIADIPKGIFNDWNGYYYIRSFIYDRPYVYLQKSIELLDDMINKIEKNKLSFKSFKWFLEFWKLAKNKSNVSLTMINDEFCGFRLSRTGKLSEIRKYCRITEKHLKLDLVKYSVEPYSGTKTIFTFQGVYMIPFQAEYAGYPKIKKIKLKEAK